MSAWSIYCYGSTDCNGPIHEWFNKQDAHIQAALITTLNILKMHPDWNDSSLADRYYPDLQDRDDDCEGLGEIMFSAPLWSNSRGQIIEYRALGQQIEQGREFLILAVGAKGPLKTIFGVKIRRRSRFYRRECPIAKDRLEQFKQYEVSTDECCFKLPEQVF